MKCFTFVVAFFALSTAVAGEMALGGDKTIKKGSYEEPLIDQAIPYEAPSDLKPEPNWRTMKPLGGGNYTTLSGFYDFQSNGGSVHNIQVEPGTGNINVVYMTAPDSADPAHPARNVFLLIAVMEGQPGTTSTICKYPGRHQGRDSQAWTWVMERSMDLL